MGDIELTERLTMLLNQASIELIRIQKSIKEYEDKQLSMLVKPRIIEVEVDNE
jgi:hypothetical protein